MKTYLYFLIVLFLICTTSEGKKKVIVHLIPHSHNDAGWLKSFEGYYQENTKDILTNVVKALEESKDYTFHWADIAFLYRWWQDQDSSTRESVKKLVADERFIFINGGWVINDEALPSYKETIAQMRLGLDFLKRTFNVRPHIGWQIDPFGSTALTASVFHKLGFSAFIENRISNDFKDILEKKEGYNFCWQGHQVDEFKQEDRILAHILQFFYTVPETRLDRGFIDINKKSYSSKFWDQKIQKVINELKKISDDSLKEYHVMVPAGDDFAFQQASEVFHAFDDLKKYLKKKGKSKGYNVEIKYSNIYKYFEDLKAMELDFGVFKGDFMPYQETWPNWDWNDFWTGYYSTRLHMKRWIRHTFNNLESTKALLTIKALQANNGSVNFNSNTEVGIEMINNIINEAEQRWAIMMHHDAITGTHTKITEQDYYNLLKESNDYLSRAYKIINQVFEVEAERSVHEILSNATEKLGSQKFDHYTVVNPTADARSEVINITLSSSLGEKDIYSVFVDTISLNKTSEFKNVQGAYADMQDMDTMSHQTQTVRKLFVHVELPPFSDIHLYIIPCSTEKSQCESSGYCLSTKIEPSIKVQDLTIKNNAIKLEIGSDGRLRSIENLTNNMKSGLTERFTAFSTRSTRSGFYLYNPRSERITIDTGNVKMWYYELPNLKCIIQVEHDANNTRFLKTYSIDHVGLKENLEQFFLEIHCFTSEAIEISFGIKKDKHSHTSKFKTYVDDSMKLVQRPIFDKNINIEHESVHELYGYFTSPCVNGGMLLEAYHNGSKEELHQFSWANSNPIGCTLSQENQIDFMVFRNIEANDNKGIFELYSDPRTTYTSFMFRLDKDDGAYKRNFAGSVINSPLFLYQDLGISLDASRKLPSSGTIFEDIFHLSDENQGTLHGAIDVVDIKLARHTILSTVNEYEVVMILRNRFNNYLSLNKTIYHDEEGLFKNKFIDTLKRSPQSSHKFKCDDSKTILEDQRYEIETCEYLLESSKPDHFHGLAPYELAEFRLVKSATLEALDIKQKIMDGVI